MQVMELHYRSIKKIPELCVPAGNFKILKYAVEYGADAVYAGGSMFNLRTLQDNFTVAELESAVNYTHEMKKKFYLTLNAIISENEIDDFLSYLEKIKNIRFDAIIASDPGAIKIIKNVLPGTRIHISTQASISNHEAVNFWGSLGASRVNIARELGLDEINKICSKSDIEIEVFVHGALCISYSGRCMLSKYLSNRDANKGKCSHTCRWKYYLMEEKRPNTFFPVDQDRRGTYIYNSRDLCLIDRLDEIADSGVDSIKIEGRMKTENYVSSVTWAYRQALDLIKQGKYSNAKKALLLKELDKTTHRTFTSGFMFNKSRKSPELADNDNVGYIKKYRFAGTVTGFSEQHDGPVILARNQVKINDILDILQPGKNPVKFKLVKMVNAKSGQPADVCNTNDSFIICGLGKINDMSLVKVKL